MWVLFSCLCITQNFFLETRIWGTVTLDIDSPCSPPSSVVVCSVSWQGNSSEDCFSDWDMHAGHLGDSGQGLLAVTLPQMIASLVNWQPEALADYCLLLFCFNSWHTLFHNLINFG